MNGSAQKPPKTDVVVEGLLEAQPVFYAFFPLACFISDNSSAEKNDDIAASQEVELTAQFDSPGGKVELSGLNFSRWISLQGLCSRLSKSESPKSQIFLDNCSLGRHGAVVIARSFTHVFIRGGNYHAQWLPLMYQNSKINVLSIVNNNIGPDGAAAFAAMLRVNSGLRELNVSSNCIRCDGLQYLASALFVNDSLRFLCLNNNEICGIDEAGDGEYDPSGLTSLVRVLRENTTLRTLKLAENDIKDFGAGILADAITSNSGLRALDVSGNNLFHDLEMSFGQGFALKRNPIILKNAPRQIRLQSPTQGRVDSPLVFESPRKSGEAADGDDDTEVNPFKSENSAASLISPVSDEVLRGGELRKTPVSLRGMGGRRFIETLGSNCKLTHIDLSFNDMGPKGALLLCNSIAKCQSLYYLELKGNPIMSEGAMAIADMMKENTTIQILGLERTGIDSAGVSYFAPVLSTYKSLKKLNISLNDIGDEGANKLTVNLKKNSWLKCLYLHRCNLGSDGVAYISSMLQVNDSIRHIGLSCNDIGEAGMMALSATMLLNRSVVSLDISETKLRRRQGKVSEVGSEGWSALASMIRVNSHLNVLNITGYDIPNESLEELLEAMNARRVCLLKADFRDLKWKYDTILQAIDAERSLLTATVKCSYTRIHLCGESGVGKTSALRNWLHLDSSVNSSPLFGSDFFGLAIFSQPILTIPPTVGINVHFNTIGSLSVVSWDHGGMRPFQAINHLTMGDGGIGRFVICVSSVWGTDKCRSYVHVADEITSWVRLIMTLGHKESDIAIIFLRGSSFDAAWRGKEPISCGNSSRETSRNNDRARLGSFDAGRERENFKNVTNNMTSGDAWSSLQSVSPQSNDDRDDDSSSQETHGGKTEQRKQRMERQERELMVEGSQMSILRLIFPIFIFFLLGYEIKPEGERLSLDGSSDEMLDVSLTSSTHTANEVLNQGEVNPASLNKDIKVANTVSMDKSSQVAGGVSNANVYQREHESSDEDAEEDAEQQADGTCLAPSEESLMCLGDSGNSAKSMRERRRFFEEAIQERMAGVLKWNRVPAVFTWDDGHKSGIPPLLSDWMGLRKVTEGKENRVPKLCEILLDSCIRDLKAAGEKVVSFDDLLAHARHHIRSVMPNDLRVSLNWLHRTGYVYLLDGESEMYVSSMTGEPADFEDSAAVYPTEATFPLESYPECEKTVPAHIIKSSPLRSLGKFPLLKAKIVLDVTWLFGSVIGSILSPRDILPPSIQHQLPWGDKDYLLSLRQLTALCESEMGPIQSKITTHQLICVIENMMIGAWCSSNYLFIPARLSGDKLRWLRQREISRMPLSQYGIGSGNPPVSAVMGRRIDVRAPYLLPSGMFNVLQSLLLQQYERSEWAGMSISCWESGIGIVANLPKKSKSKSDSSNSSTVCAIIEQIPTAKGMSIGSRAVTVDGMHNAGVQAAGITDIISWGDGADCPLSAVQVLLNRCIRAVEQAVLSVLAWPPKPDKYVNLARESGEIDDMKATTNTFRSSMLEDEGKFLSRVLRVEYLRPGCVLHTLALTPEYRDCAVYEDESLAAVGLTSPFTTSKGNDQLPIFVCCDHLQPRLCKHHLVNGYVLADTPGGGRAILRSVSGALERTLGVATTNGGEPLHATPKASPMSSMPLPEDWNNEVVKSEPTSSIATTAAEADGIPSVAINFAEEALELPASDATGNSAMPSVSPARVEAGGTTMDVSEAGDVSAVTSRETSTANIISTTAPHESE